MAPHMVSKEGFFGRRSELRALEACVAEVEAGRPRLVVVEGAAGIGKTALVAALLPVLAGWRRLTVTGDEAEARLPYGLLARLLSGATQDGRRERSGLERWDQTRLTLSLSEHSCCRRWVTWRCPARWR